MQASSSQHHAASLALAYGESELSRGGNEAPMRALHVLAWLGSGGPFMPFKPPGKGISPNIHEMFYIFGFLRFWDVSPYKQVHTIYQAKVVYPFNTIQ